MWRKEDMKINKNFSMCLIGCLLLIFMVAEVNYIRLYTKSNRVVRQGATVDAVVSEIKFSGGRGMPSHIIYVD